VTPPLAWRRIAVVHADHEAPFVIRVDCEAHARTGKRIDGAATGQIGGGTRGPAPGGIQKIAAPRAEQEFRISRKLTNADGELVIEQVLLKPKFSRRSGRRVIRKARHALKKAAMAT